MHDDKKSGRNRVSPPAQHTRMSYLVRPCDHEVEQRDDGPLKFCPPPRVDRRRRKRFPDDRLADIRSDEQRNTRSKPVPATICQSLQQYLEGVCVRGGRGDGREGTQKYCSPLKSLRVRGHRPSLSVVHAGPKGVASVVINDDIDDGNTNSWRYYTSRVFLQQINLQPRKTTHTCITQQKNTKIKRDTMQGSAARYARTPFAATRPG